VLECVPNFSEGRDAKVVEAIVSAIASVPGVVMLGHEMDSDHNRSVVTFAGSNDAVVEGAVRGVAKAVELIDLSGHAGVHPRVGSADVVPFIPLDGATMADAVAAAHRAGAEIWKRARVPVYFYGEAALHETRRRLELVRRSGFDGQPQDVGDVATHPKAGASVVGAREFLLAFNVDLATKDVEIAKNIAKRVRASSGGFAHVKAIGLYLDSRHRAQVSMNLTNFAATPLEDLFSAIASGATELGTSVADCEVIGFVPMRAYKQDPAFFVRASNFNESRILETGLSQKTAHQLLP
jgi:glutamate formiminotransferase